MALTLSLEPVTLSLGTHLFPEVRLGNLLDM